MLGRARVVVLALAVGVVVSSCADGEGVTRLDGAVNRDAIAIPDADPPDTTSEPDVPDVAVACSGEMAACAAGCCPGLACVMGFCAFPVGCRGTAGACAVTADCCSDLICVANRCTPAPPMCAAAATACSTDDQCCASLACVSGTCATIGPSCAGSACSTDGDCCMGYRCISGACDDAPPETVACRGGCGAGEYCEYTPNDCGRGLEGVCLPRPDACADVYAPVCGCDGMTYPNACDAASVGIDVEYSVACGAFDGGMPPSE
ncbi:MAG: hypothetical protein IT379_42285 [Deltaproteobacteria bacterium]|nr:hypothetical protein [Deltaproteobacteria bacterium]